MHALGTKIRCGATLVFQSMIAHAGFVQEPRGWLLLFFMLHQIFYFLVQYGSQIVPFSVFQFCFSEDFLIFPPEKKLSFEKKN